MIDVDTLARAYDPAAFEHHPIEERSRVAAIQWAARRELATDAAARALPKIQEVDALARDWFEESERMFDKLVAIREWFSDNQEHEVYEATDEQPEECTDECPACALREILDRRTVPGGALGVLVAERDALRAQLDSMTEKHFETRGDGKVYARLVGPWVEVSE